LPTRPTHPRVRPFGSAVQPLCALAAAICVFYASAAASARSGKERKKPRPCWSPASSAPKQHTRSPDSGHGSRSPHPPSWIGARTTRIPLRQLSRPQPPAAAPPPSTSSYCLAFSSFLHTLSSPSGYDPVLLFHSKKNGMDSAFCYPSRNGRRPSHELARAGPDSERGAAWT
jgi:hypothetical protein